MKNENGPSKWIGKPVNILDTSDFSILIYRIHMLKLKFRIDFPLDFLPQLVKLFTTSWVRCMRVRCAYLFLSSISGSTDFTYHYTRILFNSMHKIVYTILFSAKPFFPQHIIDSGWLLSMWCLHGWDTEPSMESQLIHAIVCVHCVLACIWMNNRIYAHHGAIRARL